MTVFFDTSIISFFLSFTGIISMLGFKTVEIRSGKKSWISRLSEKTNNSVHPHLTTLKGLLKYMNRKSALALVQWIAYHVLTWARNAYIWAYRKAHAHAPSKKVIDMVRGRGDANRNGGSSFYLKRISGDEVEVPEVKK